MNDGKSFIEEIKWIKRELSSLKAARPVSARATQFALKRTSTSVTKTVDVDMPEGYKAGGFTISINPVDDDRKIQVTVTGDSDFSVEIIDTKN